LENIFKSVEKMAEDVKTVKIPMDLEGRYMQLTTDNNILYYDVSNGMLGLWSLES